MTKLSKEEKEQARISLCGGLNEAYTHYRSLNDLHALDVIAFCYRQCGMPNRSQEILVEITSLGGGNVLTDDRKCVPSGGIIDPDVESLANGGTHEIPPVDSVCVARGAVSGSLLPATP